MTVIRTDKWVDNNRTEPLTIGNKLKSYFDNAPASTISNHLIMHGMYRSPIKINKALVRDVQQIIEHEEKQLQSLWRGPDVPIFILPSDSNNRHLLENYNGKSGLSFNDKLFLFISEKNSKEEIKALFTHEYNHVCRLKKQPKNEEDFVLLDTIILEGLAENAVYERLGKEYLATWTSYYSDKELKKYWDSIIKPLKDVPNYSRQHKKILYGQGFYPKMVGYCVGYYLVSNYCSRISTTSSDLLKMKSEDFIK